MKETRVPPAYAANLVANSGNTIYGVEIIVVNFWHWLCQKCLVPDYISNAKHWKTFSFVKMHIMGKCNEVKEADKVLLISLSKLWSKIDMSRSFGKTRLNLWFMVYVAFNSLWWTYPIFPNMNSYLSEMRMSNGVGISACPSDATWASWRLKSPVSRPLFQQLVLANNKKKHQRSTLLALCEVIQRCIPHYLVILAGIGRQFQSHTVRGKNEWW